MDQTAIEMFDSSTIGPSSSKDMMFGADHQLTQLRSDSIQMPSHHQTQQYTTRRRRTDGQPSRFSYSNSVILTITLLLCCCSLTSADYLSPIDSLPDFINDPRDLLSPELDCRLSQLAKTGTIVVDQVPPVPEAQELRRRATTAATTKTTSGSASSSTTLASTLVTASATASSSPLPTVFDTGIGNNFTTTTCPNFIDDFLADSTFESCLPFSMLLDTSVSFFRAEQSLVRITQVLDATCAANSTLCTQYLNSLAINMTASTACGSDIKAQIAVVDQVRTGLLAYSTMYTASCLKDKSSGSYCFANAITNTSSPTDSYVYYLPLNQTLVGGSQPTCNTCLQSTMSVFQAAAANRSSTVYSVYTDSAKLINGLCGPGFVNATIPNQVTGNGAGRNGAGLLGSLLVGLLMMVMLL